MKPCSEVLRELRLKHGYNQSELAEKLKSIGIQANAKQISRWETGINNPSIDQFIGLCGVYGIRDIYSTFARNGFDNSDLFLNEDGIKKLFEYRKLLIASKLFTPNTLDNNIVSLPLRKLPIYDIGASAGTGQFLDSDSYELVEVSDDVPESANFGLHVAGDSMEPTLEDGQEIWVHMQPTLENGDIGIFYLDGNAYVKEYRKTANSVSLISHNNEYEPIVITADNEARIYGKVVYPIS